MTRIDTTLLKDFSTLAVKKFDLDFTVDPLFKKTSADFDEGGARGLLLNHLSLDQNCKIIFDASDATVEGELEDASNEQAIMSIEHIHPEEPVDADDEKDDTSSSEEEEEEADSETKEAKDTEAKQELDTDVEMKENEANVDKDDQNQADNDEQDDTKDGSRTIDEQTKQDPALAQENPSIVVEEHTSTKENSPSATPISEESRVEIYRLKGTIPPSHGVFRNTETLTLDT